MGSSGEIRRILDGACRSLVDAGHLERVGPRRHVGELGRLTFVVEAEAWPDHDGRFLRVCWGIDYLPARDPAFTAASDAFVNGDLKGLAGKGRGVLPIRLPSAPQRITDHLPGTLRPTSEDDAARRIARLLDGGFAREFRALATPTDLASYIEARGGFLRANGIWPADPAGQAHTAARLLAADGEQERAVACARLFAHVAGDVPAADREAFVDRIRRIAGGGDAAGERAHWDR